MLKISIRDNIEKNNEDAHALMNRVEDKYFVNPKYASKISRELSHRFIFGDIDTNTRYTKNRTIYLDDSDLSFFSDCVDKKLPRTKIRIRQYSPDNEGWEKVAYAEFKIKEDSMTRKIRIRIPSEIIDEICDSGKIKFDENLVDINKDISKDLLRARVKAFNKIVKQKKLKNKIEIQYERKAYTGKNLRITVDSGLKFLNAKKINPSIKNKIENKQNWSEFIKPYIYTSEEEPLIVEIKTEKNSYPNWLKKFLKTIEATPSSFSKYVAATITHLKSEKEKGKVFTNLFNKKELEKQSNTKISKRDS